MSSFVQTGILARDRKAYCSVIHVWIMIWLNHLPGHRLSVLVNVLTSVKELLHANKSLLLELVRSVHYFKLEYRIYYPINWLVYTT